MKTKHTLTIAAILVALAASMLTVGSLPSRASHVPPLVREKNMSEFTSETGTDHIDRHEKETSVAVDPNNPNRLMAAANMAISSGLNVHEWYASSDGGRTFTRGQIPIDADLIIDCEPDPDHPNDCVPNDQMEYSDPWLAYGSDGTVYHSAIAHGDGSHGASVVVQTSSDQGQTWTDASAGVAFEGTTTPYAFADKESMAVDLVHDDNVYLTWNPRQTLQDANGNAGKQIVFTRDLGGQANELHFSDPVVISNFPANFDTDFDPPHNECRSHGPNVIVDASGTIWVAWARLCDSDANGAPAAIWVAKSTDEGQSFTPPVKAADLFNVGGLNDPVPGITGAFRSHADPTIASDPDTGRLFVAYATNAGGDDDPDVELVTSADGASWSAPIRINQDTCTSTQVQPSVAVRDGWLVVNFYSTADAADQVDDHVAYATASASPSFTEIRLSAAGTPQPTGFLGDYTAVAFGTDGVAHAVWTDQRVDDNADAYSARIDFSPPAALNVSSGPAKPFGESATFTATVTGAHGEAEQFVPVMFDVDTSGAASPSSGEGKTGAAGKKSFTYTNAHAGTDMLRVWADFDEDGYKDWGETFNLEVTWLKHPTTTTYTGPTLIADALSVQLTAVLTDAGSPLSSRLITFTLGSGLGSQTCSSSTNLTGVARCDIAPVQQPLGPGTVNAAFAGDPDYEASSTSAATIVFAYTTGGNFVIGDLDASAPGTVTFWGSNWANANHISRGSVPSRFEGFANNPAGQTSCGGVWSTSGGNSPPPPLSVPAYTVMLVTNSVTKSGNTISGTKPGLVIVRTDAGYLPSPGHGGTGHVVAVLCQ
jgi:hypothetical protein